VGIVAISIEDLVTPVGPDTNLLRELLVKAAGRVHVAFGNGVRSN
jgi:hypothetical protein